MFATEKTLLLTTYHQVLGCPSSKLASLFLWLGSIATTRCKPKIHLQVFQSQSSWLNQSVAPWKDTNWEVEVCKTSLIKEKRRWVMFQEIRSNRGCVGSLRCFISLERDGIANSKVAKRSSASNICISFTRSCCIWHSCATSVVLQYNIMVHASVRVLNYIILSLFPNITW